MQLASAAGQTHRRHRMVRMAEWPRCQHRCLAVQHARHRKDFRRLQRLFLRHIRQNRRQPLGQHTFTAAGRPQKQHVMGACRRNLQRPLHALLSHHVSHIQALRIAALIYIGRLRCDRFFSGKMSDQLRHIPHRVYFHPGNHCRLTSVVRRHKDGLGPTVPGCNGHGQHAAGRTYLPCQRQLTHKTSLRLHLIRQFQLLAGHQNAQQNGQVIHRAFLSQLTGCQIHRNAPHGKFKAAIFQGRMHPLPGFLYRRIGQTYHIKPRQSAVQVALAYHLLPVNSYNATGSDPCYHAASSFGFTNFSYSHYITFPTHCTPFFCTFWKKYKITENFRNICQKLYI